MGYEEFMISYRRTASVRIKSVCAYCLPMKLRKDITKLWRRKVVEDGETLRMYHFDIKAFKVDYRFEAENSDGSDS